MEEHGAPSPALRLLLVAKAAAVAGLIAYGADLRPLDVALWSVLSGLTALAVLSLAMTLTRREAAPRAPAVVVLPERTTITLPDPAVQLRTAAVDDAREAVLAARRRGADLEELLALAQALHEANLDLARATLSAGGWVEPALRHELALRDRLSPIDVDEPSAQRQG